MTDKTLDHLTATAILGIDTLWGGDVMNPSGTGRFIADSWFSDEPLPPAYTHPAATKVRESGGVSAKQPDLAAIVGDRAVGAIGVAIVGVSAVSGHRQRCCGAARRAPLPIGCLVHRHERQHSQLETVRNRRVGRRDAADDA